MTRRRSPLPLGDGSEADAARIMGLPLARFQDIRPQLHRRGFPLPDQDTGLFDLDAICTWRQHRHPHLFTESKKDGLTSIRPARDATEVMGERMGAGRGQGADTLLRR